MKQYKKKLKTEENNKNVELSLAKIRIKEIENLCQKNFEANNLGFAKRVTQLKNKSLGCSAAEVQKELLKGRYDININEELPYKNKVIQMA